MGCAHERQDEILTKARERSANMLARKGHRLGYVVLFKARTGHDGVTRFGPWPKERLGDRSFSSV
jgi:hypothetical protein